MRKSLICVLFIFLACQLSVAQATGDASERAMDCVELVEKAISFIDDKGVDYSLKVFSAQRGPFIDRELYIFAVSMDGVMLAHPYMKELVGQKVEQMKDAKGRPLFVEFRQVAETPGSGWVDYWWSKPGEEGDFAKAGFIKRVPGKPLYVGAGYYR